MLQLEADTQVSKNGAYAYVWWQNVSCCIPFSQFFSCEGTLASLAVTYVSLATGVPVPITSAALGGGLSIPSIGSLSSLSAIVSLAGGPGIADIGAGLFDMGGLSIPGLDAIDLPDMNSLSLPSADAMSQLAF